MLLILGLVYQIPAVQNRLAWRFDVALTALRMGNDAVGGVPTLATVTTLTPLPGLSASDPYPAALASTPTPAVEESSVPFTTPTVVPQPTATLPPPPVAVRLEPPPYELQDWNNCGPAALSMYLNYFGWGGTQQDVASVVKPLRADRNVNIDELVHYVGTEVTYLNAIYRVDGDIETLKRLLAAGLPVMVEETHHFTEPFWTNDDLWSGHYLLITAYDDQLKAFTGQDSFVSADRVMAYRDLDANWQAFNRAYIVVYPPDMSASVQAILGDDWDVDANRRNALETARRETDQTPDNAFAWFNLGSNLTYFEQYNEAAAAYDTARQIGLPQRMLRYQFGLFLAYFHAGRNQDLLALTEYALKITPNSEEALLWRGWALYRDGDTPAALSSFNAALEAHPGYGDAIYAINYLNQ